MVKDCESDFLFKRLISGWWLDGLHANLPQKTQPTSQRAEFPAEKPNHQTIGKNLLTFTNPTFEHFRRGPGVIYGDN